MSEHEEDTERAVARGIERERGAGYAAGAASCLGCLGTTALIFGLLALFHVHESGAFAWILGALPFVVAFVIYLRVHGWAMRR